MAILDGQAVEAALSQLHGWRMEGNAITREYRFPSFSDAMAFVNQVAELAESARHHPDITIRYSRVTLTLWTHSEGGVTHKDLDLAKRIDGSGPTV